MRFYITTLLIILLLLISNEAFAVRPFITDDARITLPGEALVETSLRVGKYRLQNLNVFSFGIIDHLEFSVNFIDGMMLKDETKYQPSIAGPSFQFKYRLTDKKESVNFPSIALIAGANPSYGLGSDTFKNSVWSSYSYLSITKYFYPDLESFNIHFNLGFSNTYL